MSDLHLDHQRKSRKCAHLDWKFNSDWVTCRHPDNPTAIGVCSHEHCPLPEPEGRCDGCNYRDKGCEPCCI